ncbi:hypothetical protein COBT_002142, partial [Conglomerata obtusa]
TCGEYKNYKSLRIGYLFERFNLDFSIIIRINIKYKTRQTRHSITKYFGLSLQTILKVINKIVAYMPVGDFSNNKLGGLGKIVQIDETMLNYKAKSHRG